MANWYTSQNTSWLERQAGEVSWDHGWYVQGNDHASSKQETENQLNQHFTTFSLELHFYDKSKLQWPKDQGKGSPAPRRKLKKDWFSVRNSRGFYSFSCEDWNNLYRTKMNLMYHYTVFHGCLGQSSGSYHFHIQKQTEDIERRT